MTAVLLLVAAAIAASCAGLILALLLGGPSDPPPLKSVDEAFREVDFSDLPGHDIFRARDGCALAYRAYLPSGAADPSRFVVLVHGSAGAGKSLHPLARALSAAGYAAYALDIRGHGRSGERGRIAYVGQIEDDLEDFLDAVRPTGSGSLVGFSSGGGFALRFAADPRGTRFDGYVLLAPFLGHEATTYRRSSGGWVSVGIPRVAALRLLNGVGVAAFNGLPVISFAVAKEARSRLTPRYSYTLAANFRPHDDYRADILAVARPMEIVVGEGDKQFVAGRFAAEFGVAARPTPVSLVAGVGHMDLTTSRAGIAAAIAAVDRLGGAGPARRGADMGSP